MRSPLRSSPVVVLAFAIACLQGCAGARRLAAAPLGSELPPWVLVVPASTAERTYYVGGCLRAGTLADGLAQAEADARDQADRAVRERMRTHTEMAIREAGVETSGVERAGFRALVLDAVAERLTATLAVEQTFHRVCPGTEEPGAVCDVFALLSADTALWERLPEETLSALRANQEGAVKDKIVRLLDHMLARYRNTEDTLDARPEDAGKS